MKYVRYTDELMEMGVGMSYVGKVKNRIDKGIFITLENGETAYCAGYTKLPQGALVRCIGLLPPKDKRRLLVDIESVINYEGRKEYFSA